MLLTGICEMRVDFCRKGATQTLTRRDRSVLCASPLAAKTLVNVMIPGVVVVARVYDVCVCVCAVCVVLSVALNCTPCTRCGFSTAHTQFTFTHCSPKNLRFCFLNSFDHRCVVRDVCVQCVCVHSNSVHHSVYGDGAAPLL